MDIFKLKLIALLAMILDHIAYFFPNIPMALIFHWIGRIAAPIFIFGVVNSMQYTSSKVKYLCRLYFFSVIMSIVQSYLHVELNFFRTLFIIATIIFLLDIKHNNKILYKKSMIIYIFYQVASCFLCGYLFSISNAETDAFYSYIMPALLGSVFIIEGGMIFAILGIIFYKYKDNAKKLSVYYILFVLIYMFYTNTNIIYAILFKVTQRIPFIGSNILHLMEDFFEYVMEFNIYTYGGNIFYISYQWIMILALPLILSYNKRKGRSIKFLFYFIYIIHIIVLWSIKQLLY